MKIFKFLASSVGRIAVSSFVFITAFILEQFDIMIVSVIAYIVALAISGSDAFISAIRGILRRDMLDEKLLMTIASVGAVLIGDFGEGAAVMLFFLIGETFEHTAVRRSRASIRALMDICPDEACVVVDGEEQMLEVDDVEPGSEIVIRPGERVPIDCEIIYGSADIDTSAMTGESMPRSACVGDSLDSGCVVINGLLRCRTLRSASNSAVARILALVEDANESKAPEERFITKFSRYYTPIVVACAVLLAIIPPLFKLYSWQDAVYRALIFLVISCPCALVISVPMAFFGGIGGAASRGILSKGGAVFSSISKADTVAFDKTGTLTNGKFTVSRIIAYGVSETELLSLAATAESASNHPIAMCISASSPSYGSPIDAREIAGEGIIARVGGSEIGVGNIALMNRIGVDTNAVTDPLGAVLVCRDGVLIGVLYIRDSIKPEAKTAINRLRAVGIKKTAMLSGDRLQSVLSVSDELGIDEAYGELAPADKYSRLESLISDSAGGVVYVGDGINDAPSLARANVGISMGKMGQDSAIEASDIVITSDNLAKIPEAIAMARRTVSIARENIVFALGIKGMILILGAFGIANMWLAVFADVGVAVLAILNSMRALRFAERKNKI